MSTDADKVLEAVLELTAALQYVDSIRTSTVTQITYETMQRSGFKRKSWTRKYTLADAKADADTAAIRLRNAWDLLDPRTPLIAK